MTSPSLSICIPSYNRPELLGRLLASIDADPADVEIVICEDRAPRREEVRDVVTRFRSEAPYVVRYHENEQNLGYDRNLRELIQRAAGTFLLFMGDDDRFVPGRLQLFLAFLREHADVGYVLRTYCVLHPDGSCEVFKYFPESRRFPPGPETYVALFRKSVTIAGYTVRRSSALAYLHDYFDGRLLYQLYLMAEITLREPAAFCDIPVVLVEQSFRLDRPQFGAAEAERGLFEPGRVTIQNSVNFMKGFFQITEYLDREHGLHSTAAVRKDLSKYSYPVLSIQRKRGVREFLRYVGLLNREVGINTTVYYYLYTVALVLLGEANCDRLIVRIKAILGRTPRL